MTAGLVRVQFALVFTLIFDQCRMIFPIARILFFEEAMYSASILSITVSMIHLNLAILQITTGQFRKRVCEAKL